MYSTLTRNWVTVFYGILDALFYQKKLSQKGGSVLYSVCQKFEVFEWWFSWPKRRLSHPKTMKRPILLYKAWILCFWQIYIDQNTIGSHIMHNQAMYQQNWSYNSYTIHLLWCGLDRSLRFGGRPPCLDCLGSVVNLSVWDKSSGLCYFHWWFAT